MNPSLIFIITISVKTLTSILFVVPVAPWPHQHSMCCFTVKLSLASNLPGQIRLAHFTRTREKVDFIKPTPDEWERVYNDVFKNTSNLSASYASMPPLVMFPCTSFHSFKFNNNRDRHPCFCSHAYF